MVHFGARLFRILSSLIMTSSWYRRSRADGTFDVDYEDGEFEMKVPEDLIRVKEGAASSSGRRKTFEEGDKVEGNYKGKGKWYAGRIQKVRLDGTYDIAYNDGEQETRVPEDLVRAIESADSRPKGAVLSEGMKVEANYKGKGKWYPGVIKR